MGSYFQDSFDIARSIFVYFPYSFFSIRFVSIYVVHLYSSIDTTTAWKKSRFILDRPDFHMIENQLTAVNAFARCILTSVSVDEILLSKYMKFSPNFRWLPSKHKYSILFTFTWRPMHTAVCSGLCSKYTAWIGVFARSAISSA